MNVLVTGVGGAVGLGIIKALRMEFKNNLSIIGTDTDVFAPGFYLKDLLDKKYTVPAAHQDAFLSCIKKIIAKDDIDIIFPSTSPEIEFFSQHKQSFEEKGVKAITSPYDTVMTCRDKWITYNKLKGKLPVVESALPVSTISESIKHVGLPAILKPRFGWGSKSIYKIESKAEAKILANKVPKPIFQKWLSGEEFSVDCLSDQKGNFITAVPRKRISLLAGLCAVGMTINDKNLLVLAKKLAKYLQFHGPFNFQVKLDQQMQPFIFDINPRFAGTGILSVYSNINFPAIAVKEVLDGTIDLNMNFKANVYITRYVSDIILTEDEINSVRENAIEISENNLM
jgi:carbamoyl-phosphate synthase large subunit